MIARVLRADKDQAQRRAGRVGLSWSAGSGWLRKCLGNKVNDAGTKVANGGDSCGTAGLALCLSDAAARGTIYRK